MPTDLDTVQRDTTAGLDALELEIAPQRSDLGRRFWRAAWPKLLAIALVVLIWELVAVSGWKEDYVLPGPGTVFKDLGDLVTTADFWAGVRLTMTRAITGFSLAVLIGTIVGAAVATFAPLRAAIGSLITGLQTMPSIMWFPLAILLFQLGEKAILFVVVIGAAPSVANGLISGIDYVPRTWLRVGQVLGMSGLKKYRHLILPASLPSFVSGLKQGWAFSWRSLLAGELLVSVPGVVALGSDMSNARNLGQADLVIALMVVILIIGMVVDAIFSSITNRIRRSRGLTGLASVPS